jgi:hypothetical protein
MQNDELGKWVDDLSEAKPVGCPTGTAYQSLRCAK